MPTCALLRLALVLAVMVLATGGCRVDLAVDIALDREGAGTLAVALAADEVLRDQAAAAGADPLGRFADAGLRLRADGWQVSDRTAEDGTRRVALATAFTDPAEFEALAAALATALAAPEVALLDPLTLAVTDDDLRLGGAASLVPTDAVAELGLLPDDAIRVLRDTDALGYTVTVTLPGEVLQTTGAVSGEESRTVTWTVVPGERVSIAAVGVRPARPLWPLVGGAVAGAGAVAAALAAIARRRTRAA